MSSFDDDEALFEDIYDDDDTKTTDTKTTETPTEELSSKPEVKESLSASANDGNVSTSAPLATQEEESKLAVLPPPPVPQQSAESNYGSGQVGQVSSETGTGGNGQAAAMPPPPVPQFQGNQQQQDFLQQPSQNQQYQQYQPNKQYLQNQQQPQYQQLYQQNDPLKLAPSNLGRDSGKMFIGGLNWDTTEDGLVSYFSKYGEILDYTIMKDASTGRSRGFGFLTFKDPRAVDEVIKKDHILDGKLIDPKRAIAREEQDKVGKIFVGGIDPLVNEKDFNDFFSQFGHIIDAQLMIDKDTGRSRGFGFITYDSPDAVDRVCVNKYLTLKGKAMEVKRAEPRGQHQQNQQQQQQQQQQQLMQQQYSPYANAYGQYQMQFAQNMPNFQGATPEMMQEYWQRMQQWYMYQQQQQASGEAGDGQPSEQPDQQPLNPQQDQEQQQRQNPQIPDGPREYNRPDGPRGDFGRPDGPRGDHGRPDGPRDDYRRDRYNNRQGGSGYSNRQDNGGYNNRQDGGYNNRQDGGEKSSRGLNLPKGPRRAPPTGPNSGGKGRGGYRNRGYHPYNKGGKR